MINRKAVEVYYVPTAYDSICMSDTLYVHGAHLCGAHYPKSDGKGTYLCKTLSADGYFFWLKKRKWGCHRVKR